MSQQVVRAEIERLEKQFAAKLEFDGLVTVAKVQAGHETLIAKALLAEDLTNATRNLEDLGKTCGAYDESLHVDVRVKVEYDARLEAEYHALARVRLEQAGAAGLGAVIDVEHEPVAMLAAPVVGPDMGDVSLEQPQETRQDCAGAPTPALDVQVQAEQAQAVEPIGDDHKARRKRGCSKGQLRRRHNERMRELHKQERLDKARASRAAAEAARSDNEQSVAQAPPPVAQDQGSSDSDEGTHNG